MSVAAHWSEITYLAVVAAVVVGIVSVITSAVVMALVVVVDIGKDNAVCGCALVQMRGLDISWTKMINTHQLYTSRHTLTRIANTRPQGDKMPHTR